jgi:adenine-specific DNA-methyltransferase
MEKLKLHSKDLTAENIEKLAALFPNCLTETQDEHGETKHAIDFDLLRQELSADLVEGPQERYRLDWPGKREALATANAPIAKTLRPYPQESLDFDSTKNLYIEGDNLEALKLLQETYLGKVKMIYIDPPYNTGNDFVYEDNFSESSGEYFERSNQADDAGNRLVANTDANGRFHSDWLTMLYSRLKLARNLLSDDGVIFISIDYREDSNLRKAGDQIFGEENFISQLIWEKMYTTKNDASLISTCHESVLIYAKSSVTCDIGLLDRTAEMDARYTNGDNDSRGPWKAIPLYADGERKNGRFTVTSPTGVKHVPEPNSHWRYAERDVLALIADERIYFGKDGNAKPNLKRFLSELKAGTKAKSIWFHKDVGSNDTASREMKSLFGKQSPFPFTKPSSLIKRMVKLGASKHDDIIFDFFSGSASTAHAVMQLNAEDGRNRRCIMVQLPEECDEKSSAFKAGYATIAEIGKERIRRAGAKIRAELETQLEGELPESDKHKEITAKLANLDTGFRVLKVDTSNMTDVYYRPDEVTQDGLGIQVENIKPDRSPEDLLFQVLLDWGVDLALPIQQETIAHKTVFFVGIPAGDGATQPGGAQAIPALAACFDTGLDEDFIKEFAKRTPLRAVFRDASFATDATKINIEQIFKALSPHTELKAI